MTSELDADLTQLFTNGLRINPFPAVSLINSYNLGVIPNQLMGDSIVMIWI